MKEVEIKGAEAGKLTVALSGDIDSGNADEFYSDVISAYRQNPADIVFDCAELNFIDSTTLGTFVKILKTQRRTDIISFSEIYSRRSKSSL